MAQPWENDIIVEKKPWEKDEVKVKSVPSEPSTLEDTAKGFGAGVSQGVTSGVDAAMMATPAGMLQGLVNTGKKVAGWYDPKLASDPIELIPSYRKLAAKATDNATEYEPKTTLGKYARTTGEFLPGVVAPGGVWKNLATNVAIPAAATETASQWIKGTALEPYDPYIRAATGIVSGIGSGTAVDAALNLTEGGAKRTASRVLATEATDPKKAIAAAKESSLSPMTLAEASQDVGLAQMQKKMHAKSPKLQAEMKDLEGVQNTTRQAELGKLAPENADVMSPSASLRQKVDDIDKETEALISRLTSGAKTPEAIGSNIRTAVSAVRDEAKKKIRELYKAVDNHGTLNVVSRPIQEAASKIARSRDKLAAPFSSDERRILRAAAELGETTPFKSLVEFEKNVGDAIVKSKTATGAPTEATSRLMHIKTNIRDAIDNAVDNQSSWQRPKDYTGPEPNLTADAAKALTDAKTSRRLFGETFETGPVQKILSESDFKGRFKSPDSAVPPAAFPSGDQGYTAVKSILKADPNAVQSLKDAALMRLQEATKNGKITPADLTKWKTDYGNALRAIDEKSPGFSSTFDNVTTAHDEMATNAAKRLLGAASPDEVRSTVGLMLNAKDGARQLRELTSTVTSPAALDGLRLAGVRAMQKSLSNAGYSGGENILSGAKLGKFVGENSDALKALYGTDGMGRLQAIADDLKKTQIALSNQKIGTGSDTASMLSKLIKDEGGKSGDLSLMGLFTIGGGNAYAQGDLALTATAIGGALGAQLIRSMRRAGINNVNEMVERAVMDPKLASALMEKGISKWGKMDNEKVHNLIRVLNASKDVVSRATGGRVDVPEHERIGNRLVAQAERAKKAHGAVTSSLLGSSDEMVAKALAVANKGL